MMLESMARVDDAVSMMKYVILLHGPDSALNGGWAGLFKDAYTVYRRRVYDMKDTLHEKNELR